MDAKDLRTESALSERNNDSSKYSQSGSITLQCERNKSYQDVGSNSAPKVDVSGARPCAVIGPDRVVPPTVPNEAYLKKSPSEPWTCMDNAYHHTKRPPEYPHKLGNFQNPTRNISPRQTFQENMQRIMMPPSYNSVKISDDSNYTQITEKSNILPKNIKLNVPSEAKFCDVPYTVYPTSNEQKTIRNVDMCLSSVNPTLTRTAHGWPHGNVNVRPARTYGAPELYQFQDYSNCVGPRQMVPRPNRTGPEDPGYVYADPYYHQEGNIRYKPYPTAKERFPQQRYDYVSNYANSFHTPPAFPSHKYEMQKPIPPHPYPPYPPIKYLERVPDPSMEGYQRNPQGNINMTYRNQIIHPNFGPVIGNCPQNKIHAYPSDGHLKTLNPSKLTYENAKAYVEYENCRPKMYPATESYFVNEMGRMHPMKNQVIMSNYPSMHNIPPTQYYKKENQQMKNYEYMQSHYRTMDPNLLHNPMAKHPSNFSPNTLAISPSDSNTSNDTSQTLGTSQEDCGYVSQSSTASVRSIDSGVNRIPNDYMRRYYDNRFGPIIRTSPMMSKSELNLNNGSKEKKNINVRQFLQMWNEGEEESEENIPKEIIIQTGPKNDGNFDKIHEGISQVNQEQLYVLGLVNVPSEELGKYEHIQKVSKLPENIKGYNHLELLNQFEEAIESSNMTNYKTSSTKDYQVPPKVYPSKPCSETSRPLSPLDVESKISQSVIHKEVGCNFEIKPCSPKMLNVEVATPIQNVLSERIIEKVANPVMLKSPMLNGVDDSIDCNIMKRKEHRLNINDTDRIPSCKMVNTQYSNNNAMDTIKNSYSLQDLESNSGLCLASLPRLDNDMELNFPEVNQQFINANRRDSTILTTALRDLPTLEVLEHPDSKTKPLDINSLACEREDIKSPCMLDSEKEVSKLSKYRKTRAHLSNTKDNLHAVRTDSVIIKNPDNVKNCEEASMFSPNSLIKHVNDIQHAPINLTSQGSIDDSVTFTAKEHDIHKDSSIAIDFSLNKNMCNDSIECLDGKIDGENSIPSHPIPVTSNSLLDTEIGEVPTTPDCQQNIPHDSINFGDVEENVSSIKYSNSQSMVEIVNKKDDKTLIDNTPLVETLAENDCLSYVSSVNEEKEKYMPPACIKQMNEESNNSMVPIDFVTPTSELLTTAESNDDDYFMDVEKKENDESSNLNNDNNRLSPPDGNVENLNNYNQKLCNEVNGDQIDNEVDMPDSDSRITQKSNKFHHLFKVSEISDAKYPSPNSINSNDQETGLMQDSPENSFKSDSTEQKLNSSFDLELISRNTSPIEDIPNVIGDNSNIDLLSPKSRVNFAEETSKLKLLSSALERSEQNTDFTSERHQRDLELISRNTSPIEDIPNVIGDNSNIDLLSPKSSVNFAEETSKLKLLSSALERSEQHTDFTSERHQRDLFTNFSIPSETNNRDDSSEIVANDADFDLMTLNNAEIKSQVDASTKSIEPKRVSHSIIVSENNRQHVESNCDLPFSNSSLQGESNKVLNNIIVGTEVLPEEEKNEQKDDITTDGKHFKNNIENELAKKVLRYFNRNRRYLHYGSKELYSPWIQKLIMFCEGNTSNIGINYTSKTHHNNGIKTKLQKDPIETLGNFDNCLEKDNADEDEKNKADVSKIPVISNTICKLTSEKKDQIDILGRLESCLEQGSASEHKKDRIEITSPITTQNSNCTLSERNQIEVLGTFDCYLENDDANEHQRFLENTCKSTDCTIAEEEINETDILGCLERSSQQSNVTEIKNEHPASPVNPQSNVTKIKNEHPASPVNPLNSDSILTESNQKDVLNNFDSCIEEDKANEHQRSIENGSRSHDSKITDTSQIDVFSPFHSCPEQNNATEHKLCTTEGSISPFIPQTSNSTLSEMNQMEISDNFDNSLEKNNVDEHGTNVEEVLRSPDCINVKDSFDSCLQQDTAIAYKKDNSASLFTSENSNITLTETNHIEVSGNIDSCHENDNTQEHRTYISEGCRPPNYTDTILCSLDKCIEQDIATEDKIDRMEGSSSPIPIQNSSNLTSKEKDHIGILDRFDCCLERESAIKIDGSTSPVIGDINLDDSSVFDCLSENDSVHENNVNKSNVAESNNSIASTKDINYEKLIAATEGPININDSIEDVKTEGDQIDQNSALNQISYCVQEEIPKCLDKNINDEVCNSVVVPINSSSDRLFNTELSEQQDKQSNDRDNISEQWDIQSKCKHEQSLSNMETFGEDDYEISWNDQRTQNDKQSYWKGNVRGEQVEQPNNETNNCDNELVEQTEKSEQCHKISYNEENAYEPLDRESTGNVEDLEDSDKLSISNNAENAYEPLDRKSTGNVEELEDSDKLSVSNNEKNSYEPLDRESTGNVEELEDSDKLSISNNEENAYEPLDRESTGNVDELEDSDKLSISNNEENAYEPLDRESTGNVEDLEESDKLSHCNDLEVELSVTEESNELHYAKVQSPKHIFLNDNRRSLKRSLSDSALNIYNKNGPELQADNEERVQLIWPIKRRKINNVDNDVLTENLCNIIQSTRRNSISSIYNEENLSFCILIDNSCIITEEENDEQEKICYTNLSEECLAEVQSDFSQDEVNSQILSEIISTPEYKNDCEYADSYLTQDEDEKIEDPWVEDVACVETVISDDIAEDIEISDPSSPKENAFSDNDESDIFSFSEHTDKVKYIYGDKMCNDDAQFVETLYNTPQMDVNKRLIQREPFNSGGYYDNDSLEKVLSECNVPKRSDKQPLQDKEPLFSPSIINVRQNTDNEDNIASEILSPLENVVNTLAVADMEIVKTDDSNVKFNHFIKTQDESIHSCESSVDNVLTYKESDDNNKYDDNITYKISSSPEVSSTTSEEKGSAILLKITNYKGSRVSQINETTRDSNRPSCKYTEDIHYVQSHSNYPTHRPLLTKAAQKYIPPLKESIRDLKVRLSLPQHSLMKLKQLKKSKDKPKLHKQDVSVPTIPKKTKPKFEDVLKSIDEIQFKMHKEKTKKSKKCIPKVVIKKNENGSHYASTSDKNEFNPDLTGRKWQPWVFIEKNHFIDKMAIKKKTKAIYNHRKQTYVLAEKFQKYKAVSSAKFVISPPLSNCPSTGLKYTIRLKHNY